MVAGDEIAEISCPTPFSTVKLSKALLSEQFCPFVHFRLLEPTPETWATSPIIVTPFEDEESRLTD
jgi:hypothetical protein